MAILVAFLGKSAVLSQFGSRERFSGISTKLRVLKKRSRRSLTTVKSINLETISLDLFLQLEKDFEKLHEKFMNARLELMDANHEIYELKETLRNVGRQEELVLPSG